MRVAMLSRWIHGLLLFLAALPVLARQDYEVIAIPDRALGINQHGEVTGQSSATAGTLLTGRAFLWSLILGPTITSITLPPESIGRAINERDEVAGAFALERNGRLFAAIFSLGKGWTNIDTFENSIYSEATSINSKGDATGYVVRRGRKPGSSVTTAFIYVGGSMQEFPFQESEGLGINNRGQVTGILTGSGGAQAFLYTYPKGPLTFLGVLIPGVSESYGEAINDKGQVTGYVVRGNSNTAFIYDNHAFQFLGTLDDTLGFSQGLAINDNGDVTGTSLTADGPHAFLYSHGQMLDLNDLDKCSALGPHVKLLSGEAINNQGRIVATGVDLRSGSSGSYLVFPNPFGSACK